MTAWGRGSIWHLEGACGGDDGVAQRDREAERGRGTWKERAAEMTAWHSFRISRAQSLISLTGWWSSSRNLRTF